ncbi:MAG: hypothetical protein FWH44_02880, partial [Methanomassiliicoccaceae archaeon]|nr:hypothetical protein [Methanomassiliicoccaceae archaeon]
LSFSSPEVLPAITEVYSDIKAVMDNLSELEFETASAEIMALLEAAWDNVLSGMPLAVVFEFLFEGIVGALRDAISVIDPFLFIKLDFSIIRFVELMVADPAETLAAMETTVEAFFSAFFFIFDRTNPAGFDLFYSDDGVTWKPYTVTGFGDPANYGGRVLLPTEYGLFVLTANPFNGCQIWLVGDSDQNIIADNPGELTLKKGETFTFLVRSVGLDPGVLAVTTDHPELNASIALVRELDPMIVYDPDVRVTLLPGDHRYVEEGTTELVPVYLYEVTLSAVDDFDGVVDVDIRIGGMRAERFIGVHIAGSVGSSDDSAVIILGVAVLAFVALLGAAVVMRK